MNRTGVLALLALITAAAATAAAAGPVQVSLRSEGGVEHVLGGFETPVSSRTAWEVLTDYNGLPAFVPSMKESRILSKSSGKTVVEQTAQARFLLFKKTVHVTLDVSETPFSRLSFTDEARQDFLLYEGSWRIEPTPSGCRVSYELRVRLSTWAPQSVLKGLFRRQAADLLKAVQNEMSRRSR